ncbi:MAG: SDR family oxidoreductase [Actinomycetota bacterium]
MERFTNRHAVITGGTSGIGLATAIRIVDEGGRVVVTGQDPDRLEQANKHEGITAVAFDSATADAGELQRVVDEQLGGRVDALFLNAGVGAFAPTGAIEATEFDRQFNINVRGPFVQLAALEDRLADRAAVLLNTSIVNDIGMPNSAVYSASKGALRSGMNVFATELAPRAIRVNAISPGPVSTGFFDRTGLSQEEIEGFAEQILTQVPLGRFGEPEEIAAAAAFLLSDDAAYITGTELVVDGGMS